MKKYILFVLPLLLCLIFVLSFSRMKQQTSIADLKYNTSSESQIQTTDSSYYNFAKCLASSSLTMYGFSGCSSCNDQKDFFGSSFNYVPYVECSASPHTLNLSETCKQKNIGGFPTWIEKNGTEHKGVQTLRELSNISGCNLPGSDSMPILSGVSGPKTLSVGQNGVWSISASSSVGEELTYSIDWGDTTKMSCPSLFASDKRHGCLMSPTTGLQKKADSEHIFYNAGVYTVVFTVMNSSEQNTKTSLIVNVTNIP